MSSAAAAKLSAALFYGIASLLIMFVNKFALTVYSFPSFTFLGFAQCAATVVVLRLLKACSIISFPDLDTMVLRKLFPLPIFFMLNMVSGLGGTQRINVGAACRVRGVGGRRLNCRAPVVVSCAARVSRRWPCLRCFVDSTSPSRCA
jgi:prepilin signal peptidase PulO-like enzyme (type II secretory pathway)